jgi:ribosomal protein S18 acetylase RimI-like enzyme
LLLADALKRILASSLEVASALVVVEAKNAAAAGFYQRFGFIVLRDNSRKLFLPMATVAAAW